MKKVTTTYHCDIRECGKEATESIKYSVIFTTEQTEGRSVDPYFSTETIDLCEECLKKALNGNAIFAHGAQGNNTYYFQRRLPY